MSARYCLHLCLKHHSRHLVLHQRHLQNQSELTQNYCQAPQLRLLFGSLQIRLIDQGSLISNVRLPRGQACAQQTRQSPNHRLHYRFNAFPVCRTHANLQHLCSQLFHEPIHRLRVAQKRPKQRCPPGLSRPVPFIPRLRSLARGRMRLSHPAFRSSTSLNVRPMSLYLAG